MHMWSAQLQRRHHHHKVAFTTYDRMVPVETLPYQPSLWCTSWWTAWWWPFWQEKLKTTTNVVVGHQVWQDSKEITRPTAFVNFLIKGSIDVTKITMCCWKENNWIIVTLDLDLGFLILVYLILTTSSGCLLRSTWGMWGVAMIRKVCLGTLLDLILLMLTGVVVVVHPWCACKTLWNAIFDERWPWCQVCSSSPAKLACWTGIFSGPVMAKLITGR